MGTCMKGTDLLQDGERGVDLSIGGCEFILVPHIMGSGVPPCDRLAALIRSHQQRQQQDAQGACGPCSAPLHTLPHV